MQIKNVCVKFVPATNHNINAQSIILTNPLMVKPSIRGNLKHRICIKNSPNSFPKTILCPITVSMVIRITKKILKRNMLLRTILGKKASLILIKWIISGEGRTQNMGKGANTALIMIANTEDPETAR